MSVWDICEGAREGDKSELVRALTEASEDPAKTRDQSFAVFLLCQVSWLFIQSV